LEFLARVLRQEQEKNVIQIGKKEIQLSIFADYMILHVKDTKISTKAIRNHKHFVQTAGYKINVEK
jgi:hypothetical protein